MHKTQADRPPGVTSASNIRIATPREKPKLIRGRCACAWKTLEAERQNKAANDNKRGRLKESPLFETALNNAESSWRLGASRVYRPNVMKSMCCHCDQTGSNRSEGKGEKTEKDQNTDIRGYQ